MNTLAQLLGLGQPKNPNADFIKKLATDRGARKAWQGMTPLQRFRVELAAVSETCNDDSIVFNAKATAQAWWEDDYKDEGVSWSEGEVAGRYATLLSDGTEEFAFYQEQEDPNDSFSFVTDITPVCPHGKVIWDDLDD